jgi:hypothetical protein
MMRIVVVVKTLWLFGWLFFSTCLVTTCAAWSVSVSSVTVRPTQAAHRKAPFRTHCSIGSSSSFSSSIHRASLTRSNLWRDNVVYDDDGSTRKTPSSNCPMTIPSQSGLTVYLITRFKERTLSVWKRHRRPLLVRWMAVLLWGLLGWYGGLAIPLPARASADTINTVHTNKLLFFPGGATTASAKRTTMRRLLTGSGVVLATVAYGASRVEQYRKSRRRSHETKLLPEALLNVDINCAAASADSAIVNSYATMSSPTTTMTTTSTMASTTANQFQYDSNAETATTTTVTTAVETVTLPSPLEQEPDSSVALSDVGDITGPEMGDTANAMAAHEQAVDTILPNDPIEQGALPKVLQKLFQNGANKYAEKSTAEETSEPSTTGINVVADSNVPTPLEEVSPPLFFADALDEVLEPSPTETTPSTKSTSSASSNGLSSAKEKISQFFFPALKRDDATSAAASPPATTVPGIDQSATMSTKAARSSRRAAGAISLQAWSNSAAWTKARQQPKSAAEEARLQAKYAAIASLEERAFTILVDLGMVTLHSPPPRPLTTVSPATSSPAASTAVVNDETEWA